MSLKQRKTTFKPRIKLDHNKHVKYNSSIPGVSHTCTCIYVIASFRLSESSVKPKSTDPKLNIAHPFTVLHHE